jgi:hypothetical protein
MKTVLSGYEIKRGEGAVKTLLCDTASRKLSEIGIILSGEYLSEILTDSKETEMPRDVVGRVTFSRSEAGNQLNIDVGSEWKICAFYKSEEEGGRVGSYAKNDGEGPRWVAQDLPRGGAAITEIFSETATAGGEESTVAAYIGRKSHMFAGLLWDPSPLIAAESVYYPSGNLRWRHRYQNGSGRAGKPSIPVFESFWENGQPCIVEYGTAGLGRSRPIAEGPAYAEHYPNGKVAVKIFTESPGAGAEGGGASPLAWQTFYYKEDGSPTTREVLEYLKNTGGRGDDCRVRELEDRGISRRDEMKFIEKFCQDITSHSRVDPSPIFVFAGLEKLGNNPLTMGREVERVPLLAGQTLA